MNEIKTHGVKTSHEGRHPQSLLLQPLGLARPDEQIKGGKAGVNRGGGHGLTVVKSGVRRPPWVQDVTIGPVKVKGSEEEEGVV